MIPNKQDQGPVLLVCVYNRFGNIITHDYLYELFRPYGDIVKILIFEKAKVWKTFIQYQFPKSTVEALQKLNNKVIFEDGSKMNIFHSKLKHVEFQNDNLGGVNYQTLKSIEETPDHSQHEGGIRKRNNTFQDYYSQSRQYNSIQMSKRPTALFECFEQSGQVSCKFSQNDADDYWGAVYQQIQKSEKSDSLKPIFNNMGKSDSTFHRSGSISGGKECLKNSFQSFNNLGDVDDLFREIALESNEYREWEEMEETKNRKKSKTIVNPHSEQFMLENCPSRVIFIRSIPECLGHQCIYNIFVNFGSVARMIFMKEKSSALIEYEDVSQAIRAKDEINYAKSDLKIFYSHYESLVLRKNCENELSLDYSNKSTMSNSQHSQLSKKKAFNPPSDVLYVTMVNPSMESQIKKRCLQIGCKVKDIQWKQNGKDKWMCLIQFHHINDSLQALGMLQNEQMSSGKKIRLAFTRSKIHNNNSPSRVIDKKNFLEGDDRQKKKKMYSNPILKQ